MSGYYQYYVLCMAALFAIGNSQIMGPADVRLKSIERCPGEGGGPYQYVTIRRINRTTEALDGNGTSDIWIDDKVGIYITVEELGDGGYKKVYEMRDDNACEFVMRYAPQQVATILRMAGLEEKCPIPPGSYRVQNYMFDYDKLPPVFYGDFLGDVQIMKDGKTIQCARLRIVTTPKDPIRNRNIG